MCTVTFIPVKEKVFITSNRDEKHWRSVATAPAVDTMKTGKILFPKDTHGGGTWFAVHENGNAVVFLNGAWQKHIPEPPYRKSRGLILLDFADSELPLKSFDENNLENIEPFTAIIWQDGKLSECRWDGSIRYSREMEVAVPHIWSSVTLYDDPTIRRRRYWFEEWMKKNPAPTQEEIFHFHQFTGDGDKHNYLLMNRNNMVFTVSITAATFTDELVTMRYTDLLNPASPSEEFLLHKAIQSKQ